MGGGGGHAEKAAVGIGRQVLEGGLRKSGHGIAIGRLRRPPAIRWQFSDEPSLAHRDVE